MADDIHAQRELRVFRRFAGVAPLGIRLESNEKRAPPAPDIRCSTRDGPLAVEMV